MRILGLIPARGGSKGVPKKNIKLLGKKPLIEYTIDGAKNSKLISQIVISTDDEETIKNILTFKKSNSMLHYFKRS